MTKIRQRGQKSLKSSKIHTSPRYRYCTIIPSSFYTQAASSPLFGQRAEGNGRTRSSLLQGNLPSSNPVPLFEILISSRSLRGKEPIEGAELITAEWTKPDRKTYKSFSAIHWCLLTCVGSLVFPISCPQETRRHKKGSFCKGFNVRSWLPPSKFNSRLYVSQRS